MLHGRFDPSICPVEFSERSDRLRSSKPRFRYARCLAEPDELRSLVFARQPSTPSRPGVDVICPRLPAAERRQQDCASNAEREVDSVIGNVSPRNQCSGNSQEIRISLCFKSAPSANLRSSTVGSDYYSCTQRLSAALVFERYSWKPIQPRLDVQYLRATLHFDTVDTRTFEQRFLHAGVIDIQRDFAMWRRCMQITRGKPESCPYR